MDNETKKMFELLMNKLDSIENIQKGMQEEQKDMKKSFNKLEDNQNRMQVSFDKLEENQKYMLVRQDEIFSLVKAIEHSNNTHKAEIDNITYKVLHTEGTINKIGEVINDSRAIK